jgi:hypothetical protein
MTLPPGTILADRTDRLGGRMIAIANAMRLAHLFDRPLRIHWPAVNDIGADLNDPLQLFDAGFAARHILPALPPDLTVTRTGWLSGQPTATARTLLDTGAIIATDMAFDLFAFADEDPADVAAQVHALWDTFPLAPTLRALRDRLRATLGTDTVAYHLRRGDILHGEETRWAPWPDKHRPDEYVDRHLALTLARGLRPLVFTDHPPAAAALCARHPQLIDAATILPSDGLTPAQSDAAAFIALSLCRTVYGARHSAFSLIPTLLGGGTCRDILDDLPADDLRAATAALAARLSAISPAALPGAEGEPIQSAAVLARTGPRTGLAAPARAAIGHLIDAGLEASCLYPLHAELAVITGDPQDTPANPDLQRPDLARLRVAEALTSATPAPLAATALWLAPGHLPVLHALSLLYLTGRIDAANFFPLDPASPLPPRSFDPVAQPHLTAYAARHGLGPDLPDLDALLVDWSPLLHDIRDRVPARWLALPLSFDTPRARSLRLLADPATPVTDMAALAAATPDDPFLQHRLSRIARRAGDLPLARTAAETALNLAPIDAARHAWAGLLALQSGDHVTGRTRIRTAMEGGLMLPGLAVALSRAPGSEDDQTAPLINALAHAPGDPRLFVPLAEAQIRHGNATAASGTLAALERAAPDHPRLPALRAALVQ